MRPVSLTLCIGEAVPAEGTDGRMYADAAAAEHPDAPSFPGDPGRGNVRSTSWATWSAFLRDVGLHALFRDPHAGLMRGAEGCTRLRPEHVAEVAAALDRYRTQHPDARPGLLAPVDDGDEDRGPWLPESVGLDGTLARLVWLEWWMRWAVATCANPVVAYG